jgi:hypothetical protein
MKKLQLKLDDLDVTSFVAEVEHEATGTVNGLQRTNLIGCTSYGCPPITGGRYTCVCTVEADCYASKYCSGPGCVMTVGEGCMTSNESLC